MKKLFLLSALALATLGYANTTKTSEITNTNLKTLSYGKVISKSSQKKYEDRKLWYVMVPSPCGPVNCYFYSSHEDGSSEFIKDLANAVNHAYNTCMWVVPYDGSAY